MLCVTLFQDTLYMFIKFKNMPYSTWFFYASRSLETLCICPSNFKTCFTQPDCPLAPPFVISITTNSHLKTRIINAYPIYHYVPFQISAHVNPKLEAGNFEQTKLRTHQSKPSQDEPEGDNSYKPQGRNMEFSVKLSPSEVLSHLGQPVQQPAQEDSADDKPYAAYQPRQPCYSRGKANYESLMPHLNSLQPKSYAFPETPTYPSIISRFPDMQRQSPLSAIIQRLIRFLGRSQKSLFSAEPKGFSSPSFANENLFAILPCIQRLATQCFADSGDVPAPYSNEPLAPKQSWLQKLTGVYASRVTQGLSNILDTLLTDEPDTPTKSDLEAKPDFGNFAEGCYQPVQPSSDANEGGYYTIDTITNMQVFHASS